MRRARSCCTARRIAVDAFGFRDRSWGPRTQFGPDLQASGADRGGYSYATASERDGFHTITMDWGSGCTNLHGYLLRDGTWSKLATGNAASSPSATPTATR